MVEWSPLEQAIINYCVPRGIRISDFEDLWSDRDRDAVWWWLVDQANRCDGCGQPLDESMKKENSFAYRAEGVRCHGCYAIASAGAQAEGGKARVTAGWRWQLTKTGDSNGRVDDAGAVVSETESARG
jgi:hypothetical protein